VRETDDAFDKTPLDADPVLDLDAEDSDTVEDFDAAAQDASKETSADDLDQPDPQPVFGGSGYVWSGPPEDLTTWWWSLPEQTRSALAALRPGAALDPVLARAVIAAGLPCPRVPTVIDGRRVMHFVATAALVQRVNLARMAHSERRLV
jgi:hypothetical protein